MDWIVEAASSLERSMKLEIEAMRFKELDTVVLRRDLRELGLRAGDVGAVVHVYEPEGLEVEFVTGSGETVDVVTLKDEDVRAKSGDELLSVRRLDRSS